MSSGYVFTERSQLDTAVDAWMDDMAAAKLISIEEKFDPEKAEKLFYTHLISKQKIDESLFKSNQHTKLLRKDFIQINKK